MVIGHDSIMHTSFVIWKANNCYVDLFIFLWLLRRNQECFWEKQKRKQWGHGQPEAVMEIPTCSPGPNYPERMLRGGSLATEEFAPAIHNAVQNRIGALLYYPISCFYCSVIMQLAIIASEVSSLPSRGNAGLTDACVPFSVGTVKGSHQTDRLEGEESGFNTRA